MRVMYIATGKHSVADGGETFEFDNSDGSAFPNYKNSRILSENCGSFVTGKYPHLFKRVDDLPPITARPINVETLGDNFVRLRPTTPPVAPAADIKTDETPKSRIYGKGKKAE
jgi:hypothetical protein